MLKFRLSGQTITYPNQAIGHYDCPPFNLVGPMARVTNCPIDGTDVRLTCNAVAVADTFFSIPAATRYMGHHVGGYITSDEQGPRFCPMNKYKPLFETVLIDLELTDTFGGQANYSWVRRETIAVPKLASNKTRMAIYKAWAGWTGHPCKVDQQGLFGDVTIRPQGLCQVLFATYNEQQDRDK